MHRPDHDSAVAVRPAAAPAGTPGWFQDGNPAEGIRGTVLQADLMNDIVGNLLAVLTAGGVTPVKGQDNNLRDAIASMIAAGTIPVGSITAFPATTAPSGWLKANGALLSRTTYAGLWAFAQASGNIVADATWLSNRPGSFSTGDGSTTFRIPDLRGQFLRGFHDGSGSYESDTGAAIGQYRDSQNKAHSHRTDGADGGSQHASRQGSDGPFDFVSLDYSVNDMGFISGSITGSSGGTEAYPRHNLQLFCIKY